MDVETDAPVSWNIDPSFAVKIRDYEKARTASTPHPWIDKTVPIEGLRSLELSMFVLEYAKREFVDPIEGYHTIADWLENDVSVSRVDVDVRAKCNRALSWLCFGSDDPTANDAFRRGSSVAKDLRKLDLRRRETKITRRFVEKRIESIGDDKIRFGEIETIENSIRTFNVKGVRTISLDFEGTLSEVLAVCRFCDGMGSKFRVRRERDLWTFSCPNRSWLACNRRIVTARRFFEGVELGTFDAPMLRKILRGRDDEHSATFALKLALTVALRNDDEFDSDSNLTLYAGQDGQDRIKTLHDLIVREFSIADIIFVCGDLVERAKFLAAIRTYVCTSYGYYGRTNDARSFLRVGSLTLTGLRSFSIPKVKLTKLVRSNFDDFKSSVEVLVCEIEREMFDSTDVWMPEWCTGSNDSFVPAIFSSSDKDVNDLEKFCFVSRPASVVNVPADLDRCSEYRYAPTMLFFYAIEDRRMLTITEEDELIVERMDEFGESYSDAFHVCSVLYARKRI